MNNNENNEKSSKIFLITGGANGIGRHLVEFFADRGHQIVFGDIDVGKGEDLAATRQNVDFKECNVVNEDSLLSILNFCYEKYGRVDVLINNAGVFFYKSILELTTEQFDSTLHINLRSAFILTREYAKRHDKSRRGRIINITSTRAYMSEPNTEAYSASKGGLAALTHASAISLSNMNITVNAIAPGWIHTGDLSELREIDHQHHPSQRVGTPEDIAKACNFIIEDNNEFFNAQTIVVDGGMTKKMIYTD